MEEALESSSSGEKLLGDLLGVTEMVGWHNDRKSVYDVVHKLCFKTIRKQFLRVMKVHIFILEKRKMLMRIPFSHGFSGSCASADSVKYSIYSTHPFGKKKQY